MGYIAPSGILGDVEPIQGLLEDGDLMGKMVETARLYWTNNFLTVDIFSSLFNGTILIMAALLFIYVFDLLASSNLGELMLQKKSYDVAAEEATYALGAILELQEQVDDTTPKRPASHCRSASPIHIMLIIILRWQSCSNTPLEEASHLPEKIKKHPIRISMVGATRHMPPSFFIFNFNL